jgi:hypothetical protein
MATIKTIRPSRVRSLTKREWREMTSGQRWSLGICVGVAALFLNAGLPGTAPLEGQAVQGTLKPAAEVVLPAVADPSVTTDPGVNVTTPQAASAPADEQSTSPPPDTTPDEPSPQPQPAPKPQPAPGLVPPQLLGLVPQQLLDLLGRLGVL